MQNVSLRKYLMAKRVELYEEVNNIKDLMLYTDVASKESLDINLAAAQAQLDLVKKIITICKERNRY